MGIGTKKQSCSFSQWLDQFMRAQNGGGEMAVPCGTCTACCRSSYFIHIRPDEIETLNVIPSELLFPAPGLPAGNVLLGYNRRGSCPLLVDNKCSIYQQRPRTCRIFDCRIFAVSGIIPDEPGKEQVANMAARWDFVFSEPRERERYTAVQEAAEFIRKKKGLFPVNSLPETATQQAVLAVHSHEIFLGTETGRGTEEAESAAKIKGILNILSGMVGS